MGKNVKADRRKAKSRVTALPGRARRLCAKTGSAKTKQEKVSSQAKTFGSYVFFFSAIVPSFILAWAPIKHEKDYLD